MERYRERLKERKLKLTPRRKAIIELFIETGRYLTPEAVWRALQKRFRRCGLPGVYRNLESLCACGILTQIQKFDRNRYYGFCGENDHHHHHIVCVKCGRVEAVEGCGFEEKRTVPGFRVLTHFVQLNGICNRCG